MRREEPSYGSHFSAGSLFFSPDAMGIGLFDANGDPVTGDISSSIGLWDAGTERNEAPEMGPNQAPRQSAADTGSAESVVSMRTDGTRAIPAAGALVAVSVSESGGTYTVEIENTSGSGALVSPIAPIVFALHQDGGMLFEPGAMASAGLEKLAEDGDPSQLASEIGGDVDSVGVAGTATPTARMTSRVREPAACSR